MTVDPQSTKEHRGQAEVRQLLTTQERQELVQLIQKMAGYEDCLGYLGDQLDHIKEAVVAAYEAAETLLDDDALQALTSIKKLQKNAKRKAKASEHWEPDIE